MSKICERSVIEINCVDKDEAKAIMSKLREKGYRTSENIYWSKYRKKYSAVMTTNFKKLILN